MADVANIISKKIDMKGSLFQNIPRWRADTPRSSHHTRKPQLNEFHPIDVRKTQMHLNEMDDIQTASDIATQLLNSSDSRVAAAAKRIFSNAIIEEKAYVAKTHLEMEKTEKSTNYESSSASSLVDIPSDVKEAASAIGMLVEANRMAAPSPCNMNLSARIVGTNAANTKSTAPTAICLSSPAPNPQASEPQMDVAEELLNPQESSISIRKKPSSQAERLHRR